MKNKKGFTLVELLAVIAILAILVIIALPNVLSMFRNAKKNTFADEVQNLVKSAENKYLTNSMNNVTGEMCFDSKNNKLDMTGRDNIIYKIKLSETGKIIEVNVRDDNYELIAKEETGINRADLGNKYKVESAKTSIIDCNGNTLSEGEEQKTKYVDSELNGADPVLKDPMIPIMLSNDGKATYAHDYDEWYNYAEKKWANAVILVDTPSKEYKAGEEILESDIRAYFVWIPKYSYRLFNMGDYDGLEENQPENQADEIEIEFGTRTTANDDVKKECASPMESGENGDCDIGDLMTHPAFLSIPSNGFWVGKFETGYNQNENIQAPITTDNIATWSTANAQKTENYTNTLENKIIVKPNVYSWRNQTVATFFQSAYSFNRNLDSHMMKNTEWGAVAYLSYSKYGIMNEVRINNNSNYLTGYAADTKDAASSETANKQWNTATGKLASTTGNIYGVYDMSGGAWEYMASYMENNPLNSGMNDIVTNSTYSKYIDKYSSSSTITSYKFRILGDATGELGPFWNNGRYNQSTWFADDANFVDSFYPWFLRGGFCSYTTRAGQFSFSRSSGDAYTGYSARLVLEP